MPNLDVESSGPIYPTILLPIEVDLSNILGFIYLEPRTIKEEVKVEDIIIAIKGLALDKALGLKKITN